MNSENKIDTPRTEALEAQLMLDAEQMLKERKSISAITKHVSTTLLNKVSTLERELNEAKFLLENANEAISLKSPEFEGSSAFVRLYQSQKKELEQLRSDLKMCAEALDEFAVHLYNVTLRLQLTPGCNPEFQAAYRLYRKHDIEFRKTGVFANPRIQAILNKKESDK